ncbi:PREDICTED: serine/arginine repetitive matrix protein 1-like [Dufourea novaeangliae]|uniref:serine/arginine repetitive matrix protein 1-like n=1 Tax=Dufourea novaeangliae TaxID=178035 RepID=UPI00076754A3|nr:PREDICTED: serine/arginine repetitive matrix protein 1-like [Dufourea novaeangliae]
MHDLRKHSSDDTRMAREARFLQVPEVLPNPKPRCTCPKSKTLSPSPPAEPKEQKEPEKPPPSPAAPLAPVIQEPPRKLYYSASLNVERPEEPAAPVATEKPELKKHASEDTRLVKAERIRERPKLERSNARVDSQTSKKWGAKEKVVTSPVDEAKKPRPKWAMKPHFSLPVEDKKSRWRSQDSAKGFKAKSLKDRPKYSVRRSLSPEPDPRQITKLENRIVRRLISPEITIMDAKWAPYENDSPLPTIGVRKREPKHISEIKWTPYDDSSPTDGGGVGGGSFAVQEPEESKDWSPFHNVTPTHHPPPEATPCRRDVDDDEFRWRILNQVSAFPIYQASPVKRQRSQQSQQPPPPQPQPVHRKSIANLRGLSKKKAFRARSESGQHPMEHDRLVPPTVIVRAASEEPKSRQRPQLTRSKALLEVPVAHGITKRSLSEEVPRARARERPRAPNRARSEEAPKYDDPWFANDSLNGGGTELREYVTTV